MIKVEKALLRDSGEIVNLELKSAEFPLSIDLIKMFFTVDERNAFVAKIGNRIVGSALVSYDKADACCLIHSLVVHPDFRFKEVSRKLLDSMSIYATTCGLKSYVIKVPHYQIEDKEDPYNIKEWLDKVGFKFITLIDQHMFRYGYYYDAYVYKRKI